LWTRFSPDGRKIQVLQIDDIIVNAYVDEALFSLPARPPALDAIPGATP